MYNPSNKDIQFDLNSVQEGVFIDSLKAQGINDKASREILKRCKQYAIRQFIHSFNVYRLPEVFVNARRQSFNVAHVLSANSADAIYMIWIPAGTKISSETKETGKYRVGHAVIVQGGKAIGFGPYNGNIGKSQNGGVHVEDARYIMDLVSQGKATIRDVKYGYEAEKTGKRINSFIYKHHVHIKEGDITLITLDRSSGYQKYGGKAWLFSNNCINFANDLFEPSHPMPTYLEFGYGPENILIIVMNIVINRINKECNMKVVFYVWLILFWAMLVLSSIGAEAYGLNLIPMVVTVMLYIAVNVGICIFVFIYAIYLLGAFNEKD